MGVNKGWIAGPRYALRVVVTLPLGLAALAACTEVDTRLEPRTLAASDEGEGESEDEDTERRPDLAATPSDALAMAERPVGARTGFPLEIEAVDGDVALAWPDMGPGVTYTVYRSEQPYFAPGGTTSVALAELAATHYVDVGNPGRAFYQVRAWFPAGYAERSSTVGQWVTPLHTGFSKVSRCLVGDVDAEAICDQVGPAAQAAYVWDPEAQAWTAWVRDDPEPSPVLALGEVVSVLLGPDHPSHHVAVGTVPTADAVALDLQVGDNLVTVPLGRFGPRRASELLAAVPSAVRVGLWDGVEQVIHWYPGGSDFAVEPCGNVHIEVAAPSQWPPPLPPCPCPSTLPVWADVVAGTAAPTDVCFDEEHPAAAGTFEPGTQGLTAGRRHPGSPYHAYKLTVGTLTPGYVAMYGLDPALVGAPGCVSYDDRQGQHEIRHRLVTSDEATACETLLRQAFAAQEGAAYCCGTPAAP